MISDATARGYSVVRHPRGSRSVSVTDALEVLRKQGVVVSQASQRLAHDTVFFVRHIVRDEDFLQNAYPLV
jgi:hypothetical protein